MSQTLNVGFPFLGYFSRGQKHEAPPDYLTADSRDWDYAPRRGKWKRRAGSVIKGDTFGAQVGILPAKWTAKGRQLFEMTSDSLTNGSPTVAGLWTYETDVWGQLSFYNTNTSAWQVIGSRFATDYAADGAFPVSFPFRPVPVWSENVLSLGRFATEKQRREVFPGTRRLLQSGKWLYAPNQQGTPLRWNLAFNDTTTAAGQVERVRWSGHTPPLKLPVITIPAATTTGYESWGSADRFILTVAFRFEDGSIGRPFIPRPPSAVPLVAALAVPQNRAGWVTALDAIGGKAYNYITWTNIPSGPPGTVSRILMRTPKVGVAGIPSIYAQVNGVTTMQLGIVAEIPNNNITNYTDYNGNDASLFVDAINIRFADHKWPRRGQYMFTFDGHVAVCGKLKANPAALLIAPQIPLDETGYDAGVLSHVSVRDDQVVNPRVRKVLMCADDAIYPTTGIVIDTTTTTLQSVSDKIQSSIAADLVFTHHDWTAQIVPGADPSALADYLDYTQVYMNFTTVLNNATITMANGGDGAAGSVANVKAGMWITGTGIPTKTYIGTVSSPTCTLVDVDGTAVLATANGTVACRVGWNTGDLRPGEVRAFTEAYPAPLYFTKAYLDGLGTDDRAVDFTGADPGHPRDAANSWYALNTRSVPAKFGRAMGGGEVKNAGIVYYSRGKGILTNIRAGKSGLDSDWTMQGISGSRGAISPNIVQGNNWCAALTADGIEITDDQTARIISGAIYDSGERTGEWAYEIQQCRIAAITGTDGGYFNMMVAGSRLYVSYRSSLSVTYPDRYMVYDFSPSEGLSGVNELLRPDGSPYGWSCPHQVRLGAMCEVQDATSPYVHLYGTVDANAGSTGNGRVDEFETGTADNAVAIVPVGYHSMLTDPALQEFTVSEIETKYKKNGTGFSVGLSRDKTRTGGNVDLLQMPTSGSDEFKIQRKAATQQMANAKECLEFFFLDDGSGTAPEFDGLVVEYEKIRNYAARR